jgi:hypothetical protein
MHNIDQAFLAPDCCAIAIADRAPLKRVIIREKNFIFGFEERFLVHEVDVLRFLRVEDAFGPECAGSMDREGFQLELNEYEWAKK